MMYLRINLSAKVPRCNEQDTVLGTVGNTGSLKCGPYSQESPTDLQSKDRAEGGDGLGGTYLSTWAFMATQAEIWYSAQGFPDGSAVKNLPANAGDAGLIPGWGRPAAGGNCNPLQCSCLENPHGQRSLVGYSSWGWQSWTQLSKEHIQHTPNIPAI